MKKEKLIFTSIASIIVFFCTSLNSFRELGIKLVYTVIEIADKIPIITSTANNSTNVNPFFFILSPIKLYRKF